MFQNEWAREFRETCKDTNAIRVEMERNLSDPLFDILRIAIGSVHALSKDQIDVAKEIIDHLKPSCTSTSPCIFSNRMYIASRKKVRAT